MLCDISHNIPDSWRKRVKLLSRAPVDGCIKSKRDDIQSQDEKRFQAEGLDEELASQYYTPAISGPSVQPPTERPNSASKALCIPGAIAIDPNVRARAHQVGMKVSENVVWLLVIAAREYADSVLKSSIASVKAIEAGQVPARRPRYGMKRRAKMSPAKDDTTPGEPTLPPGVIRCITAPEVHALTASMPTGAVLSLGGSVSRLSFERSLFSSLDMSSAVGGIASDEVRQYITSELLSSIAPKPMKVEPSTRMSESKIGPPLTQASETRQPAKNLPPVQRVVRPPIGGLGRGAKDLGALKARSSFTRKDNTGGPVAVAAAQSLPSESGPTTVPPESGAATVPQKSGPTTAPPESGPATAPPKSGPATAPPKSGTATAPPKSGTATAPPETTPTTTEPPPADKPGAQKETTSDVQEQHSQQINPPMPKQQPMAVSRRGKGFGVKNLRAMMARSSTVPKPEDGAVDEPEKKDGAADEPEKKEGAQDEPEKKEGAPDEPEKKEGAPDEPEKKDGAPDEPEKKEGAPDEPEKKDGAPDEPEKKEGAPDEPEKKEGAPDEPEKKDGAPDEPEKKGEDGPTSSAAVDQERIGDTKLQFEPPKANVGSTG
jgi:hypothetical protein